MGGPSVGRPHLRATHYQVLDITSATIENSDAPAALIKRAYRRALLQNHPDKAKNGTSEDSNDLAFTVDQMSQAFAILSSPRKRAEYNAALRLARTTDASDDDFARFQTGIENVDLDDLDFDDSESRWYRSCRCGNDRGYTFQEHDLEDAAELGELMVGCQDCSLWLKVHFAVTEE